MRSSAPGAIGAAVLLLAAAIADLAHDRLQYWGMPLSNTTAKVTLGRDGTLKEIRLEDDSQADEALAAAGAQIKAIDEQRAARQTPETAAETAAETGEQDALARFSASSWTSPPIAKARRSARWQRLSSRLPRSRRTTKQRAPGSCRPIRERPSDTPLSDRRTVVRPLLRPGLDRSPGSLDQQVAGRVRAQLVARFEHGDRGVLLDQRRALNGLAEA